ncbi:MAG: LysR family transcriptional regulator [Verrucomicrobia bacterium]|nr:LysR family transcriptional regulator [Verrucomicrobiota bacterium]MBO4715869.1 LysR family transcriptional regulator [Verrucomicrobiota bacterium]MBO4797079.1 LysR family transcriptional regulator [Verrucomicrobiota bacterium]MBR5691564.1 LysR family transcriptional regulator [Verrucomicrobiota bacterium]MBR5979003.1 LysR family transcriptional regulator [Verrucomicrobiota bacterium]
MQIESIKMFCDLAETESFTKAAQINGITQSAVSQQIRAMEKHFGCHLVERSKKKFRLTREGDLLNQYGLNLVKEFDELRCKLLELRDVVSGTIRLATIYSIGLHDLPLYLRKYLRQYPSVSVQVEYRRANQVYEDVLSNVVDIGMVAYPMRDTKLEIIPLHRDKMVLITSVDHPFVHKKSIHLKDLNGQKFVGFETGTPTRKAVDKLFLDNDIEVDMVMEFDNVETVKRAVEINNGVSLVPSRTVAQEVSAHSIVKIIPVDIELYRPIAAIVKRDKPLSPAMREFIAALKNSGDDEE